VFEGTTIAARYKSLLKITGTGNDVFHATTLKIIEDGDGNNSCIQLAQNRAEIVPVANHANAFEVSQADGTQIFNIASDTPALTINAATVTLTQDTNFVTSTGVNGMSIDGTTFSVDGNNNRVGIGTATPSKILDVTGSGTQAIRITSTNNSGQVIIGSDTDEGMNSDLIFESGTTARGRIYYDHNTTQADQKMHFKTGDDAITAMSIDGAGKIGIGTATPDETLDVAGRIAITTNNAMVAGSAGPVFTNVSGFGLQISTLNFGICHNAGTALGLVMDSV
jgi:hypothetical protein